MPAASAREGPPHAVRTLFAVGRFRLMFGATCASSLGSWMQVVAVGWLAYKLTGSATAVGGMTVAAKGPSLVLTAYSGALAERFDVRRVGITLSLIQAAACGVAGLLALNDRLTVPELYVATLVVGCAAALLIPLTQGSIRYTVSEELRPLAIRFQSIGWNTARLLGPAAGGVLIHVAGVSACFGVNALSFLALTAMFAAIKLPKPAHRKRRLRMALAVSRTNLTILRALAATLALALFVAPVQELAAPLAHRHGSDAGQVALLLAALGAGAALASALLGPLQRHRVPDSTVLGTCTALCAVGTVLLGLDLSLGFDLGAVMLIGVLWELIWVTAMTAVQLAAPEAMSRALMGLFFADSLGGVTVGAVVMGVGFDLAGIAPTMIVASMFLAAAGAWLGLGTRRESVPAAAT